MSKAKIIDAGAVVISLFLGSVSLITGNAGADFIEHNRRLQLEEQLNRMETETKCLDEAFRNSNSSCDGILKRKTNGQISPDRSAEHSTDIYEADPFRTALAMILKSGALLALLISIVAKIVDLSGARSSRIKPDQIEQREE